MSAPARANEPLIETLPLDERIRRRAHELYVQCGNLSGSEMDDWLQAEEEIRRAQEQAIDEFSRLLRLFLCGPQRQINLHVHAHTVVE